MLEKNMEKCAPTSIKVAVNAIANTVSTFKNNEIDKEEAKKRIDKINKLTTKFLDNCSCSKRLRS